VTSGAARQRFDFGSIVTRHSAERAEKTPVAQTGAAASTTVKPVRIARDEISAKPDKVSSDHLRNSRQTLQSSEKEVTVKEPISARDRVVKPITRPTRAGEIAKTAQPVLPEKDKQAASERRTIKPLDRSSVRDGQSAATDEIRRSWDRRGDRRNEPTIQSGSSKDSRDRMPAVAKPRPSSRTDRRVVRAEEYDSRIVINGNNNVIVQGDVTSRRPRPYIPRQLWTDAVHIRRSPGWRDYGSYFSLSFSINSCGRIAYVPYGGYYGFTYYYPRYHRRYIFVSVGGWWPHEYRYRRYYWYGCHPYYWYGPTVIREYPTVQEYNTYNTYNYYGTTAASSTENAWRYPFGDESYDASDYVNKISPVDEPEFETAADLCFSQAVDLFTAGKYEDAAAQFREAVRISPNDIILPFTYSQALFANGDYAHAAGVLRAALAKIPEDELTIYYPRGLYKEDEALLGQIGSLVKAAEAEPFASDYELLLGYQYLGLGELEKAAGPLTRAAADPANEQAAGILMELAARLQETAEE